MFNIGLYFTAFSILFGWDCGGGTGGAGGVVSAERTVFPACSTTVPHLWIDSAYACRMPVGHHTYERL